jgi:hypothetical protein
LPQPEPSRLTCSTLNILNPITTHISTPLIDIKTQKIRQIVQQNLTKTPKPPGPQQSPTSPISHQHHIPQERKNPPSKKRLHNDHHHHHPTRTTARLATAAMARRLPSPTPRSRNHAQAARTNDPLDENRFDADHRRATDGLRRRRDPRQPQHPGSGLLVE